MAEEGRFSKATGVSHDVRHDRLALMAFVSDPNDEAALRHGLSEAMPEGFEIRRGGVRAAIAAMERMATPRTLIVDVSNEDQPLSALGALSEVVEPDVQVLVIGDTRDGDFYREITRGLGAVEYLARPLTRDRVTRHFAPIILGRSPTQEGIQGGRIITVTGARGGAGATTIAVNLAWHFGSISRRHTLLLDADLQTGTAALLLNAQTGNGLRTALESPDRVDELFVERAAQPVGDRLHVLAAQESLTDLPTFAPNAARHLMEVIRRRYAFVVVDVPFGPVPLYHDLLELSHQRVLVMEPSLAAVRDAVRLLQLPAGNDQSSRPVVVLNRMGIKGGMNRRQVEDALQTKVDVVLPDLPQVVQAAANVGEPVVAGRSQLKALIADLARNVASSRLYDAEGASIMIDRTALAKRRWPSFLGGRT